MFSLVKRVDSPTRVLEYQAFPSSQNALHNHTILSWELHLPSVTSKSMHSSMITHGQTIKASGNLSMRLCDLLLLLAMTGDAGFLVYCLFFVAICDVVVL